MAKQKGIDDIAKWLLKNGGKKICSQKEVIFETVYNTI